MIKSFITDITFYHILIPFPSPVYLNSLKLLEKKVIGAITTIKSDTPELQC